MAPKKRIILSVDGGGVRGLIPVRILETLESRLKQRGAREQLHCFFDLMAGTSTGGLTVASLSAPRPGGDAGEASATISELRSFYERDCRDIFQASFSARLAKAVTKPLRILDETYDERLLEQLLKDRFGWTSMASGLTRVLLTAYDIEQRKALFLTNAQGADGAAADDYYFWHAVRAATATPAFFEPARVENLSSRQEEALVDASFFANNPSFAAYVQACSLGWSNDEITIISLGTGRAVERKFHQKEAAGWGAIGWLQPSQGSPLLTIASDAQAQLSELQAEHIFKALPNVTYHRFDADLPIEAENIDNARPGNIILLNGVADRIIRNNTVLLDALADVLTEHIKSKSLDAESNELVHAA